MKHGPESQLPGVATYSLGLVDNDRVPTVYLGCELSIRFRTEYRCGLCVRVDCRDLLGRQDKRRAGIMARPQKTRTTAKAEAGEAV